MLKWEWKSLVFREFSNPNYAVLRVQESPINPKRITTQLASDLLLINHYNTS